MDMAIETKIRERAYAFWLESGMGEGDAERHWLNAEQAVRGEMPAAAKKSAAKPAPKSIKARSEKAAASAKAAAPRRPKAAKGSAAACEASA